jgi:hypothetical protein
VSNKLTPNQLKWVEGLESGKYTQTRNHLEDANGNCCLGVGARIAMENGLAITTTTAPNGIVSFDFKSDYLTDSVMNWLGLRTEEGQYQAAEGITTDLTDLNDVRKLSFAQIAAIIRSNPEGLFV